MIVYTKQGARSNLPSLTAYEGGVYIFNFYGDLTYTDPADSSVWTWKGVNPGIEEILGVAQDGINLFNVQSYADCLALDGSFYWDDANGYLYVHWTNSVGFWAVSPTQNSYAGLVAGYASGYNKVTKNYFDGVYYKGLITQLSGFSKKADPIKLGLIAFDNSSYTLSDQANDLVDAAGRDTVGVPLWAYYVEDDAIELTNEDRIFTAFLNGYSHNRDAVTANLIEVRLFENKPVCQNVLSIADYPSAGDNADKIIPVPFGDIRGGFMLLTNFDDLDDTAGTAIFLVADPALYPVLAITKVFDKDGIEQTITATNLTNCLVSVTKPADVSPSDLKEWSWTGSGYDIDGDYNNGMDIAKAGFLKLTNTPYLASTFDTAAWTAATGLNTQPVGISIQSDKGFIEELLQPISISLQGVFEILGDGRISFASRDITAPVSFTIEQNDQLDEPVIKVDPDKVVSELLVEYSPDFPRKQSLTSLYTGARAEVINNYGLDRRDPLSPIKTILVNQSDAAAVSLEIMSTSKQPERLIEVGRKGFIKNPRLFSIIKVDTGTYGQKNYEYGEMLAMVPDLINMAQTFTIRILPDYVDTVPTEVLMGQVYSDGKGPLYNSYSDGKGPLYAQWQITGGK